VRVRCQRQGDIAPPRAPVVHQRAVQVESAGGPQHGDGFGRRVGLVDEAVPPTQRSWPRRPHPHVAARVKGAVQERPVPLRVGRRRHDRQRVACWLLVSYHKTPLEVFSDLQREGAGCRFSLCTCGVHPITLIGAHWYQQPVCRRSFRILTPRRRNGRLCRQSVAVAGEHGSDHVAAARHVRRAAGGEGESAVAERAREDEFDVDALRQSREGECAVPSHEPPKRLEVGGRQRRGRAKGLVPHSGRRVRRCPSRAAPAGLPAAAPTPSPSRSRRRDKAGPAADAWTSSRPSSSTNHLHRPRGRWDVRGRAVHTQLLQRDALAGVEVGVVVAVVALAL